MQPVLGLLVVATLAKGLTTGKQPPQQNITLHLTLDIQATPQGVQVKPSFGEESFPKKSGLKKSSPKKHNCYEPPSPYDEPTYSEKTRKSRPKGPVPNTRPGVRIYRSEEELMEDLAREEEQYRRQANRGRRPPTAAADMLFAKAADSHVGHGFGPLAALADVDDDDDEDDEDSHSGHALVRRFQDYCQFKRGKRHTLWHTWDVVLTDDNKYSSHCGNSLKNHIKRCAPTGWDCKRLKDGTTARIKFRTLATCSADTVKNAINRASNGDKLVPCIALPH